MVGDAVGEDGVGGGGEVNGPAGGFFLLEVLEELAVVGEVGDIELDGGGEVAFEGSFSLNEPAWEPQERCGFVTGERQGRVDEGVGLDEGSVEVDAERGERCRGELIDRD